MHHAYVIEAEAEEGVVRVEQFIAHELGMTVAGNPDLMVLRYGLLGVAEAREISQIAAQGAIGGDRRAIIIAASRVYHEAQNALLKIFEKPPTGTYLFLIVPSLGTLLPTLRSRVQILEANTRGEIEQKAEVSEAALEFMRMSREARSALIKKLATGKDEEERREHRDESLAIVNGIEVAAYRQLKKKPSDEFFTLLSDIAVLRAYLHERSAPVRMILEHLSLVLPPDLL